MVSYLGLERCRKDTQTKGLSKEENMKWENSLSTGPGDRVSKAMGMMESQMLLLTLLTVKMENGLSTQNRQNRTYN